MSNRRRLVAAMGAGALTVSFCSFAQQPTKPFRIGMLLAEAESRVDMARVEALRAGLRDLGYFENKNIIMEFRRAEGSYDRLPALAAELARLKSDVIVAFGIKAAIAAKGATVTIPIVVPATADPVATGLVASLARPGGNITGSSFFGPEIASKQLELVKEIAPQTTQVAVLFNPLNISSKLSLRTMVTAGQSLKLSMQPFEAQDSKQIEDALEAITRNRIRVVLILTDTLFIANAIKVADLAMQKRLLLVGNPNYAEVGGLIGYGPNQIEMHRNAAVFVDKILKGTKPSDIPVEQATKFDLIINMKTAKALGIKIPQTILVRVTKEVG